MNDEQLRAQTENRDAMKTELRLLIAKGLDFSAACEVFAESNPKSFDFVTAAHWEFNSEGSVEIDRESAVATASESDTGSWVSAWVWVQKPDDEETAAE